MKSKRRQFQYQEGQVIIGVVCLAFLLSTMVGAGLAQMVAPEKTAELGNGLTAFFQTVSESRLGFWQIYGKYMRYAALIWMGGWVAYGYFLSGGVLLYRGVSLGFTTAMLMRQYGMKGAWVAGLSYVPQNLLLVPVYLALTAIAVYYAFWRRHNSTLGKGGLRRERQKRRLEYTVVLGAALVLLVAGTLVESLLAPVLMHAVGAMMP